MKEMNPAQATEYIRSCARHNNFSPYFKIHALERLSERGLIQSDLLWLLKNGFVYENPTRATRPDIWKYLIEGTTPNSNGRLICASVIPAPSKCVKVVTVFWKDEKNG